MRWHSKILEQCVGSGLLEGHQEGFSDLQPLESERTGYVIYFGSTGVCKAAGCYKSVGDIFVNCGKVWNG